MHRWITGDDLFNELAMQRTTDRRTFVLLEGPTDCQALDPHVDEARAVTFPGYSKSVVKKALTLADDRQLARVLAVLDRDWVGLLESPLPSPNVVYTDDYDLDATMLFAGDVLERVVSAHSDRDARGDDLDASGSSVSTLLVDIAAHVGILRFANERDGLGINCQKFPVHAAMGPTAASVDVTALVRIAIGRSPHATAVEVDVVRLVTEEHGQAAERRRYCNGHDLASALSALCKRWGVVISRANLEAAIRSAFSCADLRRTTLYRAMATWAQDNGTLVWNCVNQPADGRSTAAA
jgi:hypothetical protein